MSRRTLLLMLLPITLLLAACGGSKSSSSTASTASTSTTSSTLTSTTSSTLTSSTTTASTATTSSHTSSKHGSTTKTATGSARGSNSEGGSTNVRVPATFVIRSGGKLNPPVISVPAFLAVQLSVASGDGRPHGVLIKVPAPKTLNVPAHGRRTILIGGLRAGRYEIEVDGKPGGALMIGGTPGP